MGGVLIILGILIVSSITMAMLKKNVFMKVYGSLNNSDYDTFFNQVDSKMARAMMPIYTREILKLSAYIKIGEANKVTEQFNSIIKMDLNDYQLSDVLIRGFNYYASIKDKNKCQKILTKMNEVLDDHQVKKYQRHYDILLDDSTKYINEIESSLICHRGKMKGYLEYLLAYSYQTKKNQTKYLKYLNQAMEDYPINGESYEKIIQVI